ncbi:MAG: hypothetical protein P8N76_07135 [Pirellulaceae bacterium]|nr:hypothetical protein [Pirellulaceae bacterium]
MRQFCLEVPKPENSLGKIHGGKFSRLERFGSVDSHEAFRRILAEWPAANQTPQEREHASFFDRLTLGEPLRDNWGFIETCFRSNIGMPNKELA